MDSDMDIVAKLKAENESLRNKLAESVKIFDEAEYLRLTVRQIELQERRGRRKDGFKLPSGVYETLEDIGKIEGCLDSMRRFWHSDNENARKAAMHLSKLGWDLRKQLQDFL